MAATDTANITDTGTRATVTVAATTPSDIAVRTDTGTVRGTGIVDTGIAVMDIAVMVDTVVIEAAADIKFVPT